MRGALLVGALLELSSRVRVHVQQVTGMSDIEKLIAEFSHLYPDVAPPAVEMLVDLYIPFSLQSNPRHNTAMWMLVISVLKRFLGPLVKQL